MGLFGGTRKGGRNFDWGNAALAFFGGPQVVQGMRQRRAAEEQAEAERQQREAQLSALGSLVGPGGQPLFTKQQLAGMRAEDLSELAQAIYSPAQYGPGGGSQGIRDPRTGQTSYDQAPYRVEVGRTILQGGPGGGPPQPVYQGVEPVAVEGVGVYGMRGDGTLVDPSQTGAPPPPPAMTGPANEQQLREQAAEAIRQGADPAAVARRLQQMIQGGAGPSGPRNFR